MAASGRDRATLAPPKACLALRVWPGEHIGRARCGCAPTGGRSASQRVAPRRTYRPAGTRLRGNVLNFCTHAPGAGLRGCAGHGARRAEEKEKDSACSAAATTWNAGRVSSTRVGLLTQGGQVGPSTPFCWTQHSSCVSFPPHPQIGGRTRQNRCVACCIRTEKNGAHASM